MENIRWISIKYQSFINIYIYMLYYNYILHYPKQNDTGIQLRSIMWVLCACALALTKLLSSWFPSCLEHESWPFAVENLVSVPIPGLEMLDANSRAPWRCIITKLTVGFSAIFSQVVKLWIVLPCSCSKAKKCKPSKSSFAMCSDVFFEAQKNLKRDDRLR